MQSKNRSCKAYFRKRIPTVLYMLTMGGLILYFGGALLSVIASNLTESLYDTKVAYADALPYAHAQQPAFQIVDTFDLLSVGSINGQNGWSASGNDISVAIDPNGSSNRVLSVAGNEERASKILPIQIADSDVGTLFFRMRRSGQLDAFVGTSTLLDPGTNGATGWDAFEMQVGESAAAPNDFRIRNGSDWLDTNNDFAENTWYCVWMVGNNSQNLYEIYLKGGSFTNQTQVAVGGISTFQFRNGGFDPLRSFMAHTGFELPGALYIDDIYLDNATQNLNQPVNDCATGSVELVTPTPTTPPLTGWNQTADFDNLATGGVNGQDNWTAIGNVSVTTDPADADNQVLSLNGTNIYAHRFLSAAIPNGQTGTLFYRMRRTESADAFGGGSDLPSPTDWADFEVQVGGQNSSPADMRIIDNGGPAAGATNGFPANQWVCVWLVTDNASDTYRVYAHGGNYAQQTRVQADGVSTFNFRNGTTASLQTFFTRMGEDTGIFYLDDIYVDAGQENLSSPTTCGSNVTTPTPITPTPITPTPITPTPITPTPITPTPITPTPVTPTPITPTPITPTPITPTPITPTPVTSIGWLLAENFDALANGGINGQATWEGIGNSLVINDPLGENNKVLSLSGANVYAFAPLPAQIEQVRTGTLFYRMQRAGSADAFAGGSDASSPAEFSDFEIQAGGKNDNPIDMFVIDNGGPALAVNDGFPTNQWTCVWMVANNTNDTYRVYAKGGNYADQTLVDSGGLSLFNFRNGTNDPIRTFFARTGFDTGVLYVDDIYVDAQQQNLAEPTSCNPIEVKSTCYPLLLSQDGNGAPLVPSPTNSQGCAANSYTEGAFVSLTSEPSTGWTIGNWLGTIDDASRSAANGVIMPSAEHTVNVLYSPIPYEVGLSKVGMGDLQSTPNAISYTYGELLTLTATAADGWQFVRWIGDVSSESAPLTVTVRSNLTIIGIFEQVELEPPVPGQSVCYPLTLTASTDGNPPAANPDRSNGCSEAEYTEGEVINLIASPEVGVDISGWMGTDNDVSTSALNILIMPDSAHEVGVNYAELSYTVNVFGDEGRGIVSVNEVQENYTFGEQIVISATNLSGYEFVRWDGESGFTSGRNPVTYTVTGQDVINARFESQPVNLSALVIGEGTIEYAPDKTTYSNGETVQFRAKPDNNWAFLRWEVGLGDEPINLIADELIEIVLTADLSLRAIFQSTEPDEPVPPATPVGSTGFSMYIAFAPRAVRAVETPTPNTPTPTDTPIATPPPAWSKLAGFGREQYSDLAIQNGHLYAVSRASMTSGGVERLPNCDISQTVENVFTGQAFGIAFREQSIVIGTEGGPAHYFDGMAFVQPNNSNRIDNRFYSLIFDDQGLIYAASEQKGVWQSSSGGTTWDQLLETPRYTNFVERINDVIWIGSYQANSDSQNGVWIYNPQAERPYQISSGLSGDALSTWTLIQKNGAIFLATSAGVYILDDRNQWQSIGLNSYDVRSLAADNRRLYAGTRENGVFARTLTLDEEWQWLGSTEDPSTEGPSTNVRSLLYAPSKCGGLLAGDSNGVWIYR